VAVCISSSYFQCSLNLFSLFSSEPVLSAGRNTRLVVHLNTKLNALNYNLIARTSSFRFLCSRKCIAQNLKYHFKKSQYNNKQCQDVCVKVSAVESKWTDMLMYLHLYAVQNHNIKVYNRSLGKICKFLHSQTIIIYEKCIGCHIN